MILVTGATGLVGSHIVFHLVSQDQKVRALYKTEASKNKVLTLFKHYKKEHLFANILWFEADILDVSQLEKAFQSIDFVYHCVAVISFSPKDEAILRKVNIEGTANVVNLCLDFGIKKLCHISSIATLGDPKIGETKITEESDWNPEAYHSDYAITKFGAEMEVWRAYQEGLKVVVVNPGVILGPLFWTEGSGDIYQKVKDKFPVYTTGGTGFVSVVDVASCAIQLLESEIVGERFILVSETLSFENIFKIIAQKLNVKSPKIEAKKWMTTIAWRLDVLFGVFGKKRFLTKEMVHTLHHIDYFDTSKVEKAIGFRFEKIEDYIQRQD
ncbi:NAD-dependent epimerase/dehydratase family protein [Flavobacterium amnicola]|uniref:NAD-dependent epimerase/dehydratase family protein n=1 Tax=Flavobacterium amnicola TaxID=2506422 RepID=A0A4Q1K5A5_9FLAO|nr:NAD-dependent epimerase/dehydratase family protein [Flavobacterium amnicola]RXR20772.1 NAD-dependent epimerase/dehydratase family protein [Flavobacterium amnicola]